MTNRMQPKLSFNIEDDILACFITGERSDDSILDIWANIINQCHYHNLSQVQVTMALRGKYQPFEAIEIYRAVIAMLIPAELSLAVVDLNHLSATDTQVACNMGHIKGINVSYFESQTDAKAWLLKQKSKAKKTKSVPIGTAMQANQSQSGDVKKPDSFKYLA